MIRGNTRIPGPISATDSFDVFLSHSSAQKDWVEALARNLEDAGKRVFLDKWHLVPGEGYVAGLHQGMMRSRAVVVGAVEAAMPFTEALHWVDFRTPVPYREAFARLLAGLDRQPPGSAPYYDGPVVEPAEAACAPIPRATNPVQRVLNRLDGSQTVVLLTREGQFPNRGAQALTEAAFQRLPSDRIRTIALPWSAPGESLAAYYHDLARQAGLGDGIDSAAAFVAAWRQRMGSGRWLWIISGFEHGPAEPCTILTREIRRRTGGNPDAAFILCGGEKLHHLVYSDGDNSVLSGTSVVHWPEMTIEDLRALRPPPTSSDDGLLSRLLDVSGGHPALVRDIIDAGRDSGDWSGTAMEQAVIKSPVVWSTLASLFDSSAHFDRLRSLVDRDEVGDSLPYLFDPLLRRLFWSNLVREIPIAGRPRLTWRSPAIRTTAQIAVAAAETVR